MNQPRKSNPAYWEALTKELRESLNGIGMDLAELTRFWDLYLEFEATNPDSQTRKVAKKYLDERGSAHNRRLLTDVILRLKKSLPAPTPATAE